MSGNAFPLLRRALRAWQLYPPQSPVRRKAAAALHQGLCEAIGHRDEGLSLVFLEDGVFCDGTPVAAREEDPGSAAAGRTLFDVGVRELRFLEGLTPGEVERLLEPLVRAGQGRLNPIDEDLSLLLWEADLPHIGYLLYDEHAEHEPEPEPALEFGGGPSFEEYATSDLPLPWRDEGGAGLRLSEEERLRLLAAWRQEAEHELPLKYGRLLLEVLRIEARPAECEALAGLLSTWVEAQLDAGAFSLLRRLSEAVAPDAAATGPARDALRRAADWFGDGSVFARFLATPPARPEDADAAAAWIAEAPAALLPVPLADVLAGRASIAPPQGEALRRRAERDAGVRSLCLASGQPALARWALERIAPGAEDVRRVREFLRDPDADLRRLAVAALARAEGTAALGGLADALLDADESVRAVAIESLGRCGGRAALDALLRLMAARDFPARSPREQYGI